MQVIGLALTSADDCLLWSAALCWQNGAAPEIVRIVTRLDQVRAFAQRCARDAATFIHQ